MRRFFMNQQVLFIILALGVVYFAIRMFLNRPTVSPQEAQAAIAAGSAVLVDVREPAEWRAGVAAPAELLSLSDLRGARRQWAPFLKRNRDKQILLYCLSGARSGSAAAALKAEGFNAANLGGFSRWAASGLPTRKP
jgi:rhodanese-related sulfurtransferase